MSSSDPNSKIDFLDPPNVVKKKIKAAFCEEGNIEENGLLAFVKAVLIPVAELRKEQIVRQEIPEEGELVMPKYVTGGEANAPEGTLFTISRDAKWGGSSHYKIYDDLEKDFADKKIHPGDLKKAVGDAIIELLEPIQKEFERNEEWRDIHAKAYPSEVSGTGAAGAKKEEGKKKKVRLRRWPRLSIDAISCSGLPPTASRKGERD